MEKKLGRLATRDDADWATHQVLIRCARYRAGIPGVK